jgi:hypothetical protein
MPNSLNDAVCCLYIHILARGWKKKSYLAAALLQPMSRLSSWLSTGAVFIWFALNNSFDNMFKTQGVEGGAKGG